MNSKFQQNFMVTFLNILVVEILLEHRAATRSGTIDKTPGDVRILLLQTDNLLVEITTS